MYPLQELRCRLDEAGAQVRTCNIIGITLISFFPHAGGTTVDLQLSFLPVTEAANLGDSTRKQICIKTDRLDCRGFKVLLLSHITIRDARRNHFCTGLKLLWKPTKFDSEPHF